MNIKRVFFTAMIVAAGFAAKGQNCKVDTVSSKSSVCVNTAISTITHLAKGGGNIDTMGCGLPTGVTASWKNDTIFINGTPTVSGTFNYKILVPDTCNVGNKDTARGRIIVDAKPLMTSKKKDTVCSGVPINLTLVSNIATDSICWQLYNNFTYGSFFPTNAHGLYAPSCTTVINEVFINNTSGAENAIYYISLATGACKTADTLTIMVKPQASAGNIASRDTTVCAGSTSVNLATLVSANGVSSPTFTWYNSLTGSGTVAPTTVSPGSTTKYYVSVKSNTYCEGLANGTGRDSVTITVRPRASADSIISRDTTVCAGSTSVNLGTLVSAKGVSNPLFTWYTSLTGSGTVPSAPTVAPSSTAKYYVSVKGDNYCEGSANAAGRDSVTVMVNLPSTSSLIVSRDTTVCAGNTSVNLDTLVKATSVTNRKFTWYTSLTGTTVVSPATVNPSTTTTYYVSVYGDNYCEGAASATGRKSVTVMVNPLPVLNNPKDTAFCDSTSVNIVFRGTNVDTGKCTWTSSNSGFGLPANNTGNINFTAKNTTTDFIFTSISVTPVSALGCSASAHTFTIMIRPQFSAGEITSDNQTVCNKAKITIESKINASGGDKDISYRWIEKNEGDHISNTAANYRLDNDVSGTFTYVREARDGKCHTAWERSAGEYTVKVRSAFDAGKISSDGQTICANVQPDIIRNEVTASGGKGGFEYRWFENDVWIKYNAADKTYTPTETQAGKYVYTRKARDGEDGCSGGDWIKSEGTWTLDIMTIPEMDSIVAKIDNNGNPYVLIYPIYNVQDTGKYTYQWYVDNEKIENATEQFFYPPKYTDPISRKKFSELGSRPYMLCMKLKRDGNNACEACKEYTPIFSQNASQKAFTILSNPTSNGSFTVTFNRDLLQDNTANTLGIYSALGEKIWEQTINNLDNITIARTMAAGIYMITLTTGKQQYSEKIIVK